MAKMIGLDLGTAHTRIFDRENGLVLNVPSVIVIHAQSHEIFATGKEARHMLEKTPGFLSASSPLQQGVIVQPEMTVRMLHDYFSQLNLLGYFNRPDVLCTIPGGITPVERGAMENCIRDAGARNVQTVNAPYAGALGAGVRMNQEKGILILDFGAGITEATVLSRGETVVSSAVRIGGNDLDAAIVQYLKTNKKTLIGMPTAEKLKRKLGVAYAGGVKKEEKKIIGRDMNRGLPNSCAVTTEDVHIAIRESLKAIIKMVRETIEKLPPELSADLMEGGILCVGGSAQLFQLDILLNKAFHLPVTVAENPAEAQINGIGKLLRATEDFREFDARR